MQTQIVSRAKAWADLNTVTTFDAGTTRLVDSMSGKKLTVQDIRNFSPSSLLVESLIEHLCRLLEQDPTHQKNLYTVICGKLHQMKLIDQTYGLEEFESLRGYYQKALLHLVSVAKSTVDENEESRIMKISNTNIDLTSSILKDEQSLHWSRYAMDYVELKFIAKGGFGQVFKVRHKLDGEEYAVKKIFLKYRNLNSFYRNIQEVKLLAKLNHPNIVSYKAAWLEPLYSFKSKSVSPIESEIEDVSNPSDISHSVLNKPALNRLDIEESSSIVFKENESEKKTDVSANEIEKCTENSKSLHIHKRIIEEVQQSITNTSGASSMLRSEVVHSSRGHGLVQELSGDEGSLSALKREKAVCCFTRKAGNIQQNQCSNFQHEWAVLYIQMQLCSSTLRDWLNERNRSLRIRSVDIKESLRIFHDIVLGVQYIHSQGIVHHDIKPSNVFVNGVHASQIQVGDFGLACFLQHSVDEVTLLSSHNHRGEFGTKLYAAPEQLAGKCNIKSDIYSLGLILFELVCPFQTDMERSLMLTNLRKGEFPADLDMQYPEIMHLIQKLVAFEPHERPSAQDLLRTIERLIKNVSIENQTNGEEYCKEFIDQLKEELVRKDQEIEELRKKVQALESTCKK